jgi:signal peptidase I
MVLFHPPGWPDETWIFRVIGFPGERIEINDRVISINDVAVSTEDAGRAPGDPSYYVDDPAPGYRAEADTARFARETLPNSVSYRTLQLHTNFDARLNNMPSATVPDGRLFLLGDNRENANDSRLAYLGMLPAEAVLGKVVLE